jgi:hypothetical protein
MFNDSSQVCELFATMQVEGWNQIGDVLPFWKAFLNLFVFEEVI